MSIFSELLEFFGLNGANFIGGRALPDSGYIQASRVYRVDVESKHSAQKLEFRIGGLHKPNKEMPYYDITGHVDSIKLEHAIADLLGQNPGKGPMTVHGNGGHPRRATEMSLHGSKPCYFLFNLEMPKNVRFTIDGPAASIELKSKSKRLSSVRRILDGKLVEDNRQANVRAILVAFDPEADGEEEANRFLNRFNLNLDAVDTDNSNDIGSTSVPYVPFIVDPDVRFPGGNEGP